MVLVEGRVVRVLNLELSSSGSLTLSLTLSVAGEVVTAPVCPDLNPPLHPPFALSHFVFYCQLT